jgi:hypothetical protein
MKVAVFSESSADEAAIRVLLDGLLGTETAAPQMPPIRSRGWHTVLTRLPIVLRHLHYQTDAEALVVVLDSDRSPAHLEAHREPGGAEEKCRLCQLTRILRQVQSELPPRDTYGRVKTALGLAVPQIEAWYLVGTDPHVTEGAWISGLKHGKFPYAREHLKQKVYGTDRPSLDLETSRAKEEAQRIVREGKLPLLEQSFPGGFGALAQDVRDW